MKFKIGQRVKLTKSIDDHRKAIVGFKGTVRHLFHPNPSFHKTYILIEFDNNIDGHSGDGKGKNGHCVWIQKHHLEIIDSPKKKARTQAEIIRNNIPTDSTKDIYKKPQDATIGINNPIIICSHCQKIISGQGNTIDWPWETFLELYKTEIDCPHCSKHLIIQREDINNFIAFHSVPGETK